MHAPRRGKGEGWRCDQIEGTARSMHGIAMGWGVGKGIGDMEVQGVG